MLNARATRLAVVTALTAFGVASAVAFVGTPAFASSPPATPIVTPITDPTVVSGTTTPGSTVIVVSFTAIPKVLVTADATGHFSATLSAPLPMNAIVIVAAVTPAANAESRTLIEYDGTTSSLLPITPNVTVEDTLVFVHDVNSNGIADAGDSLTYTVNFSYANATVPGVLNPAQGTDDAQGRLAQTVSTFTVTSAQAAACGLLQLTVARDNSNSEYAASPGVVLPTPGCGAALVPTLAGTPGHGTVNSHYAFAVSAGGPGPLTFATTGVLPPGLMLDPATGIVSGTPTTAGHYSFGITATGAFGSTSEAFTISVTEALALTGANATPTLLVGAVALLLGFVLRGFARRRSVRSHG